MKGKIKIIYLPSSVMTKTRWLMREMNYFEKNSDIEIHELFDFLFPRARKVAREILEETYKSEKIFTFKKFSNWKNYVLNLQQKCIREGKKLVVLSEISRYPWQGFNLRYVLANRFLKQRQIDYYEFHASITPRKTYLKNYLRYIKIFKYWGYLLLRLNEVLASFFGILLNLKPKGIFVVGDFLKKQIENLKIAKGMELINFNSWEFSSTLNKKNNDVYPSTRKYVVFINRTAPKIKADTQLLNLSDIHETSEKWYPALDNFLSYLEKIFNLEIIIASHPKSKEEGRLDHLGNRTAILNKTEELIKGSEFVIGVFSTAYVYAAIYKKPIFFIYSNETKRDVGTFDAINFLSDYFKTKPINIDESVSESQIKSIKNFDEKLYENYKNDFLASDPKNKNYQIIIEYFNK